LTNLQTGQKSVLSKRNINNLPSDGGSELVTTNIAFFSQTGAPGNGGVGLTLANCTFENPCAANDFTQTGVNTLNALLPGMVMLFNGGTYPATNGSSALTLNNGQGVFGMNANYSATASGAARSTFNGAFILNGNNTLDSIILNNSLGATTTAITSTGGQNLMLNNMAIGNSDTPYGVVMNLVNASATLTHSIAFASGQNSTSTLLTQGISLAASSLLVQSSRISVVNMSPNINPDAIFVNGSTLQFNSSELSFASASANSNFSAIGIDAQNISSVTISGNSAITVTTQTQKAIGLSSVNTTEILMYGGELTVNGIAIGLPNEAQLTFGGSNIALSGVSCVLNGSLTLC
ncbi:MAG: hypothetical protein WCB98_03305, partial [Candidatus Aquirickettsiella gammari]